MDKSMNYIYTFTNITYRDENQQDETEKGEWKARNI